MKRNKIVKLIAPSNESPDNKISPVDDSKNNKNLLSSAKSSTKELASSTSEDSDAINQKDLINGYSFVEPIQKEDSSNFIQSVMIPVQTKATSADKSEKENNSESFVMPVLSLMK